MQLYRQTKTQENVSIEFLGGCVLMQGPLNPLACPVSVFAKWNNHTYALI